MKLVHSLPLRGLFASVLVVLAAACSTQVNDSSDDALTRSRDTSNNASTESKPGETASSTAANLLPDRPQEPQQGQGGVDQQRRQTVIQESLKQAQRAMENRLWEDAARIAAEVLAIDQGNEQARQILFSAQDMLGEISPGVARRFQDRVLETTIAGERDRFRAAQEEAVGDAHRESGRYGDAIDSYERALLTLRYSIYFKPGSDLQQRLERKLKEAQEAKIRADREAVESQRAASQAELAEAERKLRIQRQAKVKRLLEQANYEFQLGNYAAAVTLIDQALQTDPSNDEALHLRELAGRARHENRVDLLRQEWKAEWSKTFDDLRTSDVPQVETIELDMERWAEVAVRQPLTFAPPASLDNPDDRAILDKLASTRIEHRFPKATVQDWAAYYQTVTEVNFVVTQPVKELPEDKTTLTDFRLPPMSVSQALEVIGNLTGVRYKVQNGVVQLVTPEHAVGPTYLKNYPVPDLVHGVQDKPGRELKLFVPGDEQEFGGGEDTESKPTVVDPTKLMDMIRQTVGTEVFDSTGSTLGEQRGVLVVRAPRELHEKIEKLLADLRHAVGVQVDVEARFLKVQDQFLEDVGVDFRGLGDQSAGGIPGRGLEQNNRSNLRFDDFGQTQTISPAAPGGIGTGTEPGLFYDDGGDGDYLARTEHLYDRSLGGGEGRLTNSGGLSLQYAYLDDVQLEVVLRAVAKQERSEEITAPRLLVYNNTRANMQVLRHISYIRDFEVEIAQAAAVANPVVDVVRDGVVLDVRPVVSADRRFITMELRPTVMTLQEPIPTFTTTLGVGQPISIQLPRVTLQRVRTTVTMPDGGTIMLGGMKLAEKQDQISGVPILKDLPGLSFLFSRKGTYVQNKKILILIRAKIIISEEYEPTVTPELARGR